MSIDPTAKDHQKDADTTSSIFRKGLGRTLLVWFLILSLLPMMVVSIFSYWNAYNSLKQEAEMALRSVVSMKTERIRSYFERMMIDLRQQSTMTPNVQFLEDLKKAYKKSGIPVGDFVKSFKWVMMVEDQGADLKGYRRTYGYHDILLIDDQGNLLFTVEGEDDLGTNLFSGKYANSLLARTGKEVLKSGRLTFSDFEHYAPSDNSVAGFLVAVMVNEDGDKIGLMAFQIQTDLIDPIMQQSGGTGKTAETYLIGADLKMRSNSVLTKKETILKNALETEQTRLWHRHDVEGEGALKAEDELILIYQGPHGKRVLGVHHPMHIAGVSLAVIAEIEESEAFATANRLRNIVVLLLLATVIVVVFIATPVSKRIVTPILNLSQGARLAASGKFDRQIVIKAKHEIGELAQSFNHMLFNLRRMTKESERQDWLKTGIAELNDRLRGEQDLSTLGRNIITYLAEYLDAQIGAIYLAEKHNRFKLMGSYAYTKRKNLSNTFALGEGLVGQAALEKESIILTQVPEDYISVSSGLGESVPRNIMVYPFMHEGEVKGVVELGTLHDFSNVHLKFLKKTSENVAIAIQSTQSRRQVHELLQRTQQQTEELQTQQEELRQTNEELEEQTQALKESEIRLQAQQEELRQANEELEEQSQRLEEQKKETEGRNQDLINAQSLIEQKAKDLEVTSKYKSEFLANMSHELRTPLNSILLLSRLLADNKDGGLSPDHMESAQAIYSSGTDLITLINDILDLSKVEAGKMELHLADMDLHDFGDAMIRNFQPLATEKGLDLDLEIAEGLPDSIRTDRHRMEQIVKNFLSNAFKFTDRGSILLRIGRPDNPLRNDTDLISKEFDPAKSISFSVTDTGIGVLKEKQKVIFEAFQQADGSTSRKYGGTGLGLSIARELGKLLGGQICLESEEGKGSMFVLHLPERARDPQADAKSPQPFQIKRDGRSLGHEKKHVTRIDRTATRVTQQAKGIETIEDDRKDISQGNKSILIIEDDPAFLKILRDLTREQGFKCLVTGDGETGLQFADYYKPSAIILDIGLPGINGWTVMARLKENPATRHIPVHFISASDEKVAAMKMGAVDYLTKPVCPEALQGAFAKLNQMIFKPVKDLLVVEDNAEQAKAIAKVIGNGDVRITFAATGAEAYDKSLSGKFDCMVLDLGLPDRSGLDLLAQIRDMENGSHLPVIVYTGRELTPKEKAIIDEYAQSTIIKGVDSLEKLLDETTLFLHRVEAKFPKEQQEMLRMMHDKEAVFEDKKVLVVDDDMRNVFSLKKVLEEKGMRVLAGKNGREGLERLEQHPEIDLVLMDIMMPEMNGFEAMREIRRQERFKDLPIVALTAKAMKGDRAKCIEAGASDYLAKPVDADRMFSVLRVWMY